MPEPQETLTGNVEPKTNEGSPPSEQASGEHAAALERTGFRFGETAPESLQGKTAAESVEYVRQLESQQRNLENQLQTTLGAVQQYVMSQQQPQAQIPQAPDGDLMVTDPDQWQRQFSQNVQAQTAQMLQQAGTPLYHAQAATAKHLSRTAEAETWKRYGAEIEGLMSRVPLAQQASPDVWNQAARIVKSNHLDEIVQERAKSLAATLGSVEQGGHSTTLGNAPSSEAMQKIRDSDYGQKNLADYSDAQIHDVAVNKMGYKNLEEYANIVAGTNIISNPKNRGEWWNRDLVRDVDNG